MPTAEGIFAAAAIAPLPPNYKASLFARSDSAPVPAPTWPPKGPKSVSVPKWQF